MRQQISSVCIYLIIIEIMQYQTAMKKAPENNQKITDYMKNKNIPPLSRIIKKPTANCLTINQPSKAQRKILPSRKISSDIDEKTIVLENDQEVKAKLICKQMVLIGPCDVQYYFSLQKKLGHLKLQYSKFQFLNFLKENGKFNNVKNLQILQQVNDEHFWNWTIPKMIQYSTDSDKQALISSRIPTLESGYANFIQISKAQVLMILINMFFCSLPRQTFRSNLHFCGLMQAKEVDNEGNIALKRQKLKCFINYFKRALKQSFHDLEKENLSIKREVSIKSRTQLREQSYPFSEVDVQIGLIESQYKKSVMIDFANKNIGGGVLLNGAVQEEILFCIFPELVASLCISQELKENQALVFFNAIRFNQYSGYSKNFKFQGSFLEEEIFDFPSIIVAIDAVDYSQKIAKQYTQYSLSSIQRQLNKFVTGIEGADMIAREEMAVCTGRWGCGAFKGDNYLKFLIQWIGCSMRKRKMIYMSSDQQQKKEVEVMKNFFEKYETSDLINAMGEYSTALKSTKRISFLEFLKNEIS